MNKAFIIGRITKELDLRITKNEIKILRFTLASQRRKEETDFINCVAWRQQAEFLYNYAKKGDMIAIVGHIETYKLESTTGIKYCTEVIAEEVQIVNKVKQSKEEDIEPNKFGSNDNERLNSLGINTDDLPFY